MGASVYLHDPAGRGDSYDWDYTYNLSNMQREALDGSQLHQGEPPADLYIARLRIMIDEFEADPPRFRKFNPENGWGDFDSFLEAAKKTLAWVDASPDETLITATYWL